MKKSIAYINPHMLTWARKTVKLSPDLAAKKIGIKTERLETWEKGEDLPTVRQLYKIARVYRRPFALFYFPKPPKHFKPLKDFRKFIDQFEISEQDEYVLHKELILFQQKREIAIELFEQLEENFSRFTLSAGLNESPEKVAQKIIKLLSIDHNEIKSIKPGYEALNYWKKLLESRGILVFQTSGVPVHVMRGTCIANEILPVIVINSNDSINGRIFSLFHELVHIVLREDGISNFRYNHKDLYDRVEVFCNSTSSDVLVPDNLLMSAEEVRAHSTNDIYWNDSELGSLSNMFCVSREVILRKLLTLGKTNNNFYLDYKKRYKLYENKNSGGGDYYRNIIAKNGTLFLELVLQGYYHEKLTSSRLSDFINVKISNLEKLEKQLYSKVQH